MKIVSSVGKISFGVTLLLRTVLHGPRHFLDYAAPFLWPSVVHDGIKILDPQSASRDDFTKLVRESLEFISSHDPARYKRICREIRLIMHIPTPTGAYYTRPFKVCCLDYSVFRLAKEFHGNVGALACILVHESIHGHLFSKGVLQARNNYSRIELRPIFKPRSAENK